VITSLVPRECVHAIEVEVPSPIVKNFLTPKLTREAGVTAVRVSVRASASA